MLIYGIGGHAKVVSSACDEVHHFFDDRGIETSFMRAPVSVYNGNNYPDSPLCIAIGNNKTRKKISQMVQHKFGVVLANSAEIHSSVTIGEGSMVLHGAIAQIDSHIGKHVILNTNCSVDHDCLIEDFVHVAPNATLCGSVSVGEGSLIGAGSVILPGVKVGKWCTIGAGSVVTKDIDDNSIVYGNPARVKK